MENLIYDNIVGLVADAIGDVTGNDETDIRTQIETGKTDELIQRIQNKMLEYGVKSEDVYAEKTTKEIQRKLTWIIEHPYTPVSDELIKATVDKLVWNITKRFKCQCQVVKM